MISKSRLIRGRPTRGRDLQRQTVPHRAVPPDHCFGLNNDERAPPSKGDPAEHNPEKPVQRPEIRPLRFPVQDLELVPQG